MSTPACGQQPCFTRRPARASRLRSPLLLCYLPREGFLGSEDVTGLKFLQTHACTRVHACTHTREDRAVQSVVCPRLDRGDTCPTARLTVGLRMGQVPPANCHQARVLLAPCEWPGAGKAAGGMGGAAGPFLCQGAQSAPEGPRAPSRDLLCDSGLYRRLRWSREPTEGEALLATGLPARLFSSAPKFFPDSHQVSPPHLVTHPPQNPDSHRT